MAKILVADDEELIRRLIGDCLKKEGHTPILASDGDEAWRLFKKNEDISLALLDIMMPGADGWEVCSRIRNVSGIPIILVSARSQDFDQIKGFESGADDYVTKPFSLGILMHRIETLLKRGSITTEETETGRISLDGLLVKPEAHAVYVSGNSVDLTLKEYNILLKFLYSPGRVFSREQILDEIWGYEYDGDIRTVDSHVARLRTKLGIWGVEHIKTIYGTGYKVE